MRRTAPLSFLILLAPLAAAQQPDSASSGRGSVAGVVIDSIHGGRLIDASVQLVPENPLSPPRTVRSDGQGRFAIDRLADGRYIVGFFHPMLDSLGIEAPVREVFIRGGSSQRLDLAIPSPARLRATICGAAGPADSGAIVIGFTRDARDATAAAHVRITGEWHQISFTTSGIVHSTPRIVSVSLDNGWYAMCGVPRGGLMGLLATRGPDSSGVVEIQVPSNGFARRDLFIASAPMVAIDSTTPNAPRRDVRRGDLRLYGTVRRAASAEPVVGAQVVLSEGPHTTTNDRGEWTLTNAPAGTRMLEVRAVGLYPERIPVNVIPDAPPIQVSLITLRAVLDTITVSARRLADLQALDGRMRAGIGRFIGPRDLARYPGRQVTDVLRMHPGVQVVRDGSGQIRIFLRGASDCPAELYIDGHYMFDSTDPDTWVRPEWVQAIEIYAAGTAPPQFQRPLSGCGSIVIWTK